MNEGTERLNKKQAELKGETSKSNSSEPYFYMALVLKGTEEQYLKLLKYINNVNGAQIIYQCKSLTYLKVTREDHTRLQALTANTIGLEAQRG